MNILKIASFLCIISYLLANAAYSFDAQLETNCQQTFANGTVGGLTPLSAELWYINDKQKIEYISQGTPLGGGGECLGLDYSATENLGTIETVHLFVYLGSAGTSNMVDGWAVGSLKLADGRISGSYKEFLTDELSYNQAFKLANKYFENVKK